MYIGLDGIPLTLLKTGVGHYTFELARALALVAKDFDFELVYPSTFSPITLAASENPPIPVNLKDVQVPVGPLSRHWWSVGLPRYVRTSGIELFHGTNYDVPLRGRCATVLTVHDLSLLLHPETHEKHRVRRARRRLGLMARASNAVITPTEAVRKEVCDYLGIGSEKVFAVPEAVRECFRPHKHSAGDALRRRFGIEGDFLLTVATLEPRKNLGTLIRAFAEVLRHNSDRKLQLVVAGNKGWLTDPLFAELEKSGVKDRIVLTGYVTDDDLPALYSSCLLFLYPSIYEGFGLPPLEAMACGAPVITSRTSALIETTGGAAYLVDPQNHQALAQAILELTKNQNAREKLVADGLKHAAKFSWEQTARKTLEVYGEALGRFRR
ncbi:MAG: glycosyltransferase family 4 protein [Pyrinomonadaceae bacterium]